MPQVSRWRRVPAWLTLNLRARLTFKVGAGLARGTAGARRHRRLLLLVIGITTGVLATTSLGQLTTRTPPSAGNQAGTATGGAAVPTAPAVASPAQAAPAQPVELRIPAIRVKTALTDLGLAADGTVQAPPDYQVAGWYAAGPAPGTAPGPPAVIVGHVDSTTGPAVFYRLRELHDGNDIAIRGLDGTTRHFKVYRAAEYPKDAFPAAEVYAPTGRAEVRLITCSGQFDRGQGSYVDNLVVYATLDGTGD